MLLGAIYVAASSSFRVASFLFIIQGDKVNKELNLNIDDLFKWKGKIEITDEENNVIETLYQRVIGDADIQKARVSALKASKVLRKALKDEESDEFIINIPFRGDVQLDEMIAVILYNRSPLFMQIVQRKVEEERVKEPKGEASLEKQENYIEDLENARKDYDKEIHNQIRKLAENLEKELREKTYDEVFDIYVKECVEILCRNEMTNTFDEYATFYGTYKDAKYKIRRFLSIENFLDLAPTVKDKLIRGYKMLELNLLDIKK